MFSKEFLKTIGVLGIAVGLTASPFALANASGPGDTLGKEVMDVPRLDGPTTRVHAAAPETGISLDMRGAKPHTLELGAETRDIPRSLRRGQEAFPGDAPAADLGIAGAADRRTRDARGTETQDVPGTGVPHPGPSSEI